jgi:HK97 gp10 family phage protein
VAKKPSKRPGAPIVTGIRSIDRKLRRLEAKVQRKIVRKAIKNALKPVLDEVKANAPVETGETRDNIKIRAGKSRRGVVRQEVRVGDKQIPEGFAAAFTEFGTSEVPAHPFMGPAFDDEGPAARDRVEHEILDEILKEASK